MDSPIRSAYWVLTLQKAFRFRMALGVTVARLIHINVAEGDEPSFDLFEGDAGVSAPAWVGGDPWERPVQELLGPQGRDDDQPKL
jgi:hypothetical protein